MQKKPLIITSAIAGGVLIIGGSVTAYFLLNKPADQPATVANGQQQGGRFGGGAGGGQNNFKNIQGKIATVSPTDMVVEQTSAQALVSWDDKTQFTKIITTDKTKVLVVGQFVRVEYKDDNTTKTASTVIQVDEKTLTNFANPSGRPNITPNPSRTRPSGNFGGGNGNGGNNNGQDRARMSLGKIESVDGDTITVTMNGDTSSKETFNIASAIFEQSQTAAASDLKVGDTVSVIGTASGNKTIARNITIN